MISTRNVLIPVLASFVALVLLPGSALAMSATDTAGDNCMTGMWEACGIDFVTASDSTDADGSVRLKVTFTGTVCNGGYGPVVTQPWFEILGAGATAQAAGIGHAWAVSSTTNYLWTPTGTEEQNPMTSTIAAGSVEVLLPASLVATIGTPFTWFVNNSCKSHPSDPIYSDGDIAPDAGLYTYSKPIGTSGDDTITGGGGDDTINAGGGNDTVSGGLGRDAIRGGSGKDTLRGGAGNDNLRGEAGNDSLFGDAGNDTLNGGVGRDTMNGGTGADVIDARDTKMASGKDTIRCGGGRDTVRANMNDSVARDCEKVTWVA